FVVTSTVDSDQLGDLQAILNRELNTVPGMIAFAIRASIFSQGLSGSRGIDIDIQGEDLADIFATAKKTFFKVVQDPVLGMEGGGGFPQPNPRALDLGQPLLEIRPDW